MTEIELVDLNELNWEIFCSMYPGDEGAKFVAPNGFSFAQSFFEKDWIVKGIVRNNEPIGFTMFGLDKEYDRYELCRLMFDYSQQGKGYGKKVIPIIIEYMTNQFNCREIFLSTNANNNRAIKLYESFNFKRTGEIIDNEVVFKLLT